VYYHYQLLKVSHAHTPMRVRESMGEVELMRRFHHPNIATIYAAGTTPRSFAVIEVR